MSRDLYLKLSWYFWVFSNRPLPTIKLLEKMSQKKKSTKKYVESLIYHFLCFNFVFKDIKITKTRIMYNHRCNIEG